ncbi:MAG: hypothetical protein ACK4PH_24010 [Aquincola tertiaricarbonis]|uniref:hypothetical protein n=1 Tax=Aquincola TaxID=391952 RepID=UPI0006153CB5|nr:MULTISPECIES: hypothetical protein [Aquincola]MCR5864213.1 hypothetical protein [Aquincola sp. J276]
MDTCDPAFAPSFHDHRGGRQHRFMESADINAAFREVFRPLRSNIRRGLSVMGQVYGIEMDTCIPGEMLATVWIPPASRGIDDAATLEDAQRRRMLFARLYGERRPEALFAYVTERRTGYRQSVLYVEIVSEDGIFAAEYPVEVGGGWKRRELRAVPHRRLDPVTSA